MKRILFLAMSVMMALTIKAVNVGDYVYTKVAKYRITGADLVTNGQFTDGSTAGWTATDETNFPLAAVFGPSEEGGVAVQPGQIDLAAGMYQAVKIDMGGTYVVSFKVKGAAAGYTDHDLTGSATNYINAYFNTDGTLGTKDGTTLVYGENGVGGGYQFSYNADDFVEVSFAVEAPQDGNIMIDFRGMAEGLIIKDVECHTAEEVYDDRLAENRIEYIRKFTDNPNLGGKDFYADMKEYITVIEEMILAGDSPEEVLFLMEDLESVWAQFAEANLSNVIELIPTKDGSANTGNNSANWMNWTSKWNKLSNDYRNQAPWSWSTDRWSHKTAAANSPLQIQWQRKVSVDWNNIATLTATLDPGTYYWGVTGQGGMMTLDKNRWTRSWANENAATQLFFNGDTTEVFILNSARNTDYVFKFELAEAKEITLGIICNTNTVATDGFDVQFINPVLYKVIVDGELLPEEKAYLDNVAEQLEALQECIDVANGYLSEANETLPWGKKVLKEGVDEAQARYAEWAALDEDALLGAYYDDESIPDTIMNNGVRFLNNNYINPFIAMNKPLTDMPGAINVAKDVLGQRIYSSSAKKADFAALIAASEELYDQMLESEYSEENAAAIIAQKAALEAMAVEFKAAIAATTIVDIDFGTQAAPACFNVIEGVNSYGELETYYTIEGNKGVMTFSDITGSYPYALGWGSATDETTGAVIATDSLGMLRIGNSEAVVNLEGLAVTENTIVNIQFDLYAGRLTKSKVGYKVLSAEDDIICGLFYSSYDGNDEMNTFGIDYNKYIPGVGSGSASNAAIAASSNKTHFDIVLDYGTKTMYCTTISSKGTVTTEAIALPEVAPAKFVLYSNYKNADRRCWFDNLKVLHISTEEAGDTPNEFDTFPFTITASQTADADGRYRYQSKVYNVAKPVTSLRFTFKETFCPNGGNPGNPPFVALGEFYLYDENGEQIILSAENFYTNAQEQSEGPIENLCDEDTYTFWHSDWHGNVQEYHYLEVTLPEGLDLTTFSFGWIDRGFNKQNIPLEVEVSSVSITDKLLFETIDNAKALNPYAGTDPGFYDADFTTFYEALAAAEALVGSGASEEELSAALAVLKAELEKVKALQMNLPVAGKSYRIVSAFGAFCEKQGVHKALFANQAPTDYMEEPVDGIRLWWQTADASAVDQEFVFEPIANDEGRLFYSVKNSSTGLYISSFEDYEGMEYNSSTVYMTEFPDTVELLPLGQGEFNLRMLQGYLHAGSHNQGNLDYTQGMYGGLSGDYSSIVYWSGGLNTPSSWYIREMSELPVTVPVSALHFRSDMIHLYSSVNSLTLTADKECAFSDLQVYDLLGNVLPATVFVSGNTATVNLMDKVASFSFSFNSRERVREVIVNGGISQISMLREAYDAAVAVAPIKGDGIMQYANLDEYEAALAHAERLLASNPTDGEIMDAIVLLELAVAHLVPNMPEPGCYYYITSAFDAFVEHQGVNMMMYANEYGEARWDYEDPSALSRCWEFEPAEYEEGYYLKNAATGMYLGAEYYMSSSLSMVTSKDETVPYVISSLDGDVVAIASSLDAGYKLHAMGHQNGMGSSGAICYWNAGVGTASAWRICKAEGYTLDTLVYAMTAQDVVAEPSSIVNIPIELKNSTAVTAFQFDLYLPEDIATVYDVVLNGYRATDSHRVAYSEQPDGALRVLVYSAEDKPFIGRSGVVADVVVGISSEASEWDYPIVLSNVRMVKTDVTEVLGTDYMATLTIVQGALMGDVNSDGQHTMGDVVMIVNALLEKEQYNFNAAVADINGDGQLTIVDVVSVVRFVLGYEPVAAARDMHREASMVAIEAGSLMAGNHGEILLPIYMASDADYTAFQMDVVLPEGLTLADATLGGRGKSSHTLSWSTLDNGATRIVAFAMDNATFKDNAEALAILTLKAEGALQEGAVINLTDGLFATASGAEDRAEDVALKVEDETTGVGTLLGGIRVSGAEGAVVVESATDAVLSIYTMTGQLVQQAEVKAGKSLIALPAGVYVVNNQKVVVK